MVGKWHTIMRPTLIAGSETVAWPHSTLPSLILQLYFRTYLKYLKSETHFYHTQSIIGTMSIYENTNSIKDGGMPCKSRPHQIDSKKIFFLNLKIKIKKGKRKKKRKRVWILSLFSVLLTFWIICYKWFSQVLAENLIIRSLFPFLD